MGSGDNSDHILQSFLRNLENFLAEIEISWCFHDTISLVPLFLTTLTKFTRSRWVGGGGEGRGTLLYFTWKGFVLPNSVISWLSKIKRDNNSIIKCLELGMSTHKKAWMVCGYLWWTASMLSVNSKYCFKYYMWLHWVDLPQSKTLFWLNWEVSWISQWVRVSIKP